MKEDFAVKVNTGEVKDYTVRTVVTIFGLELYANTVKYQGILAIGDDRLHGSYVGNVRVVGTPTLTKSEWWRLALYYVIGVPWARICWYCWYKWRQE